MFWIKKVFGSKKFLGSKTPRPKIKKTFHVGRPEALTAWKSKSVTDLWADRRPDRRHGEALEMLAHLKGAFIV